MPIEHSYLRDEVLLVRLSGCIRYEDIRESLHRIWEDPRFVPGTCQLADFREITSFELTREDLQRLIAESRETPRALETGPIAIVASGDFMFGMMRMYEQLASDILESFRVFRDYDAALAWFEAGAPE